MRRRVSGIYAIQNTVNGKVYIGSSDDIQRRKNAHYSQLRRNVHHNSCLQRAWDKYGEASFTFSVLHECSVDELIRQEMHWIDTKNTGSPAGYNLAPVAGCLRGFKHSKEFGAAISARKKGKPLHQNSRMAAIAYHLGRKQSEETKQKRADAIRKHSPADYALWRRMALEGKNASQIAAAIGGSKSTIAKIIRGLNPHTKPSPVTPATRRHMNIMWMFGSSASAIARSVGVDNSTACRHLRTLIAERERIKLVSGYRPQDGKCFRIESAIDVWL